MPGDLARRVPDRELADLIARIAELDEAVVDDSCARQAHRDWQPPCAEPVYDRSSRITPVEPRSSAWKSDVPHSQ